MYSLDVNFLNDRQERPSAEPVAAKRRSTQSSPVALYAGLVVGLGLPALMLGYWAYSQYRTGVLEQQKADLDNRILQIESLRGEFANVDSEVAAIEAEVQALATVFDRIKPWSAVLQDIRDRIPNMPTADPPNIVQVIQITQVEEEEPRRGSSSSSSNSGDEAAEGAPPPPPPQPRIQITGYATTFTAVNDFLLLLQRSPFLQGDATRLVTAELVDDPRDIEPINENVNVEIELSQQVEYTIEAQLTESTASELFSELEGTASFGLTSRIQTLRDRGVLQP